MKLQLESDILRSAQM